MVSRHDSASERRGGYVCIVFFGLGVVVALVQFIPRVLIFDSAVMG